MKNTRKTKNKVHENFFNSKESGILKTIWCKYMYVYINLLYDKIQFPIYISSLFFIICLNYSTLIADYLICHVGECFQSLIVFYNFFFTSDKVANPWTPLTNYSTSSTPCEAARSWSTWKPRAMDISRWPTGRASRVPCTRSCSAGGRTRRRLLDTIANSLTRFETLSLIAVVN